MANVWMRRNSEEPRFLEDPDVPPTNNACEREIRPSVVFRKVTGGFRSSWGAQIHAGYRSVTSTARSTANPRSKPSISSLPEPSS